MKTRRAVYQPIVSLFIGVSILLTGALAQAKQVQLDIALGQPVLEAGQKQKTYIKIGLEGITLPERIDRTPLNIALVMDRSGSMAGEKIRRAREAATMALEHFERDDIISVVGYNHLVDVLVPATRVSSRREIERTIRTLHAGGNTALFAGVSKGAAEVRKFLERNQVNRVILISDGLANVGPSTPAELGRLGRQLGKEGMAVTTIGLGLHYNEDLMVRLADYSDGNHVFAENAMDLARIFDSEFGDLGSVVAQDVVITIHCAEGIRPVRVLGREAEIYSRKVVTHLNQIYGNQDKYVLLEVEVAPGIAGHRQEVATVDVAYADMRTRQRDRLSGRAVVEFSTSKQEILEAVEEDVMVSATEQIGVERNKQAVDLRDKGDIDGAAALFDANAAFLEQEGGKYKSGRLKEQSRKNLEAKGAVRGPGWKRARKALRSEQYSIQKQQSYQ
ncbi:MAG: VWA domain-containing protein [Gammaproteobacteria bacterium]|nr:VWA domain-containing protein [Gammaproteobacteria bacterium]